MAGFQKIFLINPLGKMYYRLEFILLLVFLCVLFSPYDHAYYLGVLLAYILVFTIFWNTDMINFQWVLMGLVVMCFMKN